MADETSIQVNFARPIPLFPLQAAALLPQQVLPLHIFEPRYVQMVEHVLDGTGQFAMAVFEGEDWKQTYHGRPPIRPAVCLAQIVQHERLEPAGGEADEGSMPRYNLLVQGVCRARIVNEMPAATSESGPSRLYRMAKLAPVGIDPEEEAKLFGLREKLTELLEDGPLTRLTHADWVIERIRNEEIPTSIILELVSFALPTSQETRYRLLAEGDAGERAEILAGELQGLQSLIRRATSQHPEAWPKGLSWN
jgi:uncharacterized protein